MIFVEMLVGRICLPFVADAAMEQSTRRPHSFFYLAISIWIKFLLQFIMILNFILWK